MIVTHQNPDLDAVTSVWLLKTFGGLENDHVHFVNTGNPDPDLLAAAVAVVDTGRVYDPTKLRFDHHHLPGQAANNACAAQQVYDHLLGQCIEIEYLWPLIAIVFAGDTGRREADASRELGLHAIFSGWKSWWSEQNPGERLSDLVAYAYGAGLLDSLEARLRHQTEARAELTERVVYKSADGLVCAIRFGSTGSSFAAFEGGARIVIFEGKPIEVEGGTTYPVGIMRAGEWQEPNVGELAERVVVSAPFAAEIARWFKHPAGFFAGRGTAKAPEFEPVGIDIVQLAELVDAAWVR